MAVPSRFFPGAAAASCDTIFPRWQPRIACSRSAGRKYARSSQLRTIAARHVSSRRIASQGLVRTAIVRGARGGAGRRRRGLGSLRNRRTGGCAFGRPAVALYIITPLLVKHGRAMIRAPIHHLAQSRSGREFVPELLQEEATPERLVDAIDALLNDPAQQYGQFAELREALGPPDALMRCARFAVSLARNPEAALRASDDPDLSHLGLARPARIAIRDCARCASGQPGLLFDCGDSLRGSQTVYRRSEPIVAEIDAAGYDAQAIGNREFHYIFPLLRSRLSRMRHPARLHEPDRYQRAGAAVLALARFSNVTVRAMHVLGLLIMQYPVGSPWERVFGWRFLEPWEAVAPYASTFPTARC